MVATRSTRPSTTPASRLRRLVLPGTVALTLAAMAACGGSSSDGPDSPGPAAGTGGALGVSGSTSSTAGRSSGTAGSAAGNTSGGKQSAGGEAAVGGEAPQGPAGGAPAGGEPGKPPKPPMPPMGMGGADGADVDCPALAPASEAACTDKQRCKYPTVDCNCDGPEGERKWTCKQPKPMEECPPKPPKDAAACVVKVPAAPPCHYEEPTVDCTCTATGWSCTEAP